MPGPSHPSLRRVDIGEERIEIAYHRDGGWRSLIAQPSTLLTARNVVTLADKGLPVSSEMLSASGRLPHRSDQGKRRRNPPPGCGRSFRLGSSKRFPARAAGDGVVDIDGASGYEPAGELDKWLRFAGWARRHPHGRFRPGPAALRRLLRLVGHRTFIVHLWGPSRGGKTAAGWLATSV